MAEVPKRYFQKFFIPVSLVLIACVASWASWINSYNKLARVEVEMTHRFKEFNRYERDVYLSKIKLVSPDGSIIKLSDNDGKYTVLNVWATWCTPCVRELPSLKKLDNLLPFDSGWRVIAVSLDSKNNLPKLAQFTARYNVSDIANYNDYNFDLQKSLKIDNLPLTLILNKSGRVIYSIEGEASWHSGEVLEFLDLVKQVH